MISKLKQDRINVIYEVIELWGYKNPTDKCYYISIFDLAYNINNMWNAKYFLTKGNKKYTEHNEIMKKPIFEDYNIHKMYTLIKSVLGKGGLFLLANDNYGEYIIWDGRKE